ncbi:MAG TPA: aldehyde dehydrogenase family protein [Phycisphaerae bacterium]|nr:aldehyde dehydrogenase family protein [Phycisphaerae bacterium]HOJ72530.1 aldehyde dehydrogenase family protein [Phycisphaerae bacterium]HOQ84255.1 aldehyde dehydrogenase family protein [Phycisphaerae bacterium]HPP25178.1 aldehyde dehydrogenase family protein [Phycisphaerae bacterium]HPZ98693.1 aldehyde dehydrogenase family protein [Phycisphaerae bacterium]
MLHDQYPMYVANQPEQPNFDLEVRDKYTGDVVTRVPRASRETLERAIAAAADAARPMREMKPYQRQAVLDHVVRRSRERADEFAEALCVEAGKPIRDARGEVDRLIDTLRISAEESVRLYGEVLPMEISPRARGYRGMWKRVPVGPCAFITPFNFPLNLVAHKIGPALAAGCPFVLKPASTTPIGALLLGEILAETDLPPGAFSILPLSGGQASPLVEDDRIAKLSFTGSAEVGWDIRRRAGRKHVTLELGGNAAVIVDADADLPDTVVRVLRGAFYQSGQSCISVQRVFVHTRVYDRFRDDLVAATRGLKAGDPREEETFVGPLISESDARRVEAWVEDALRVGARLLCGGRRHGALYEPTLLENVPEAAKLSCEEVFGPVAVLAPFDDFSEVLQAVNASRYGLQAGVFTRDINRAMQAWDELEVGGVMINEVPSFRVDHMPYGGVKDSGLGREGVRWAIDSMTEPRLLVIRTG